MYGLFQTGIIAHTAIKEHLCSFGYKTIPITPILWNHTKNRISFTLVTDDFRIRYQRGEDDQNIISALQEKYEITQYWKGSIYSGITLNWEYKAGIMDISMV